MKNYNILITNDDGIESPGLKAAVEAVLDLGTVTVAAPTHQQTGAGRGLTGDKESTLIPVDYCVKGTAIRSLPWKLFSSAHCKARYKNNLLKREARPPYFWN